MTTDNKSKFLFYNFIFALIIIFNLLMIFFASSEILRTFQMTTIMKMFVSIFSTFIWFLNGYLLFTKIIKLK